MKGAIGVDLPEQVLAAIFEVSNTLGPGFLKGRTVGEYFADILVEDALVVELKCVDRLTTEHTAQCLNYLRASGRTVCLLVNFQKAEVAWKRIVNGFDAPD